MVDQKPDLKVSHGYNEESEKVVVHKRIMQLSMNTQKN